MTAADAGYALDDGLQRRKYRNWVAGMAAASLAAWMPEADVDAERIAKSAVQIADMLIAELNKEQSSRSVHG